jgi:hypothetical protein
MATNRTAPIGMFSQNHVGTPCLLSAGPGGVPVDACSLPGEFLRQL